MPETFAAVQDRYQTRNRRIVIALLVAGALMLLVAVGSAVNSIISINESTASVEHTLQVETAINSLSAEGERIETARRGFLIQPDPSFRTIVADSDRRFDAALEDLGRLIADNPAQTRRIDRVREIDRERDAILGAMFAAPAASLLRVRAIRFETDRGVMLTREMRVHLAAMGAVEQRLLGVRNADQRSSLNRFYVIGGLAFALLVILMVAAIVVVARYNSQLTAAQTGLRAINEGLEDAVSARTTDLSRANEEIQRFAYIVSHDLRSPLVNVLGFTSELDQARKTLHTYLSKLFEEQPELRDEAVRLAVEEDLPEALAFIRTSTEKMDRLINSILELSRQGRRTLKPERLDMTALSGTVADTLHQRAEAAGAVITVSSIPDLESDRIAVEQILSNLAENALKYLSPARAGRVEIEGHRIGRQIEITVTDNGRGIAPADHERIFDLFRRAGSQDQPGEGIGLANVRALAYRLGGRISVESQLDEGARFTLILPEKFPVELA